MATLRKWDFAREERFEEALVDAFPSRTEFEKLIRYGLGEDLDAITPEPSLRSAAFAVLKWAKPRGKLDRMLDEACRRNPDNPLLRAFADERALFLVPFEKDGDFVGRDADIARLFQLLKSGPPRHRRVALVGMGGVGKTQLAAEYAHRHRSEYPAGVYWVNAAAPLVAQLATFTEKLALPVEKGLGLREEAASEAEGPIQRLLAFEAYLRENPGALVIFDNIADPLTLRDRAAGLVPWDLPCDLLFTTRRHDPDARFESVRVEVLPEQAALRLLLSSKARQPLLERGRADELHAARAICGVLGHLPLAVVLAAAYLGKSPGLALSDYLLRLRREGVLITADTARVDPLRLATHHDAVVEATLRTQWDALTTREARHALEAAALLSNAAHVPRATLAHLTGLSDRATGGYPAPLELALNELSEWSLVDELTQKEIRLHPLVREFAVKRIEDRKAFTACCVSRLAEALGEVGRLDAEVRGRGLDAVLAELRLGEELAEGEPREHFRRLLRALDREAHCLRRWDPSREPGFFLQQVRNVSFDLGLGVVQQQAEAALSAQGLSWLRERLRTSRESDALVRTLAGHTDSVWAVAVLPDGRSALSASHDCSLKLWDISSGCELRALAGHDSPVNGVAVTLDGRLAVSAATDGTLKVWELESGRELCSLAGHEGPVNGVAVTPDGRFAVSASDDATLKVWEIGSGRGVRTLAGHEGPVNGVAVTPDGRLAISASDDGTLKVWEIGSGREVRTLAGHAYSVLDVAVTPDGRLAISASTDSTLKVWDVMSGSQVRTLRTLGGPDDEMRWVSGVTVTPDGRLAVSSSDDGTLKVWDLASGREIHTLEGHTEPVKDVVVTPDGRLVISTSHDKTLKVWELSSGRGAHAHEGHAREVSGLAVAPDGLFAVSASWDKTLRLWDMSTHTHVRTLEGHASRVMRVASTPDGRRAVSASEDKTLKVWDLGRGREVCTLVGHTWSVTGVAVSRDGRRAVSASGDKTLKVWELPGGREVHTLAGHAGGLTGVAIAPDGRHAISASDDATLKVWDLSTWREVHTLAGHVLGVTGVAITPDGRLVLSASEDRTIKVWEIATGRAARTLTGHTDPIRDVTVTPDGRFAISASDDTTLRVWDLASGRCLGTLEAHAPLLSCAVAPDGRTFLAGDSAGSLHVLDWLAPALEVRGSEEAQPSTAGEATERTRMSSPTRVVAPRLSPKTASPRGASRSGAFPAAAAGGDRVPAAQVVTAVDSLRSPRAGGRIKVLFLAASPLSMRKNDLSRETRRLQEMLSAGEARDVLEFVTEWAVRPRDLHRLLLQEEPDVLHFAGHGSARAQILLEDDEGNAAPVAKKALTDLFGILRQPPRLVLLNACDTAPLARALVQHVACAIGMRHPIGDAAATTFAVAFYQALALHQPVETAFRLARNALESHESPNKRAPVLSVSAGVDAATLVLSAR